MFDWLTRVRARLRSVVERAVGLARKGRVEEELDEEVRFHIDMEAERLRERGVEAAEARRRARMRFGGVERIKEEVRDARGIRWIENVAFDLRHSVRRLRRDAGLTVAVVVVLALGIGANATMFGILDRVLLSPPPHVDRPDEVRRVIVGRTFLGNFVTSDWVTWPDVVDLVEADSLQSVAAYSGGNETMSLGRGEQVERVSIRFVNGSFFPLLGTAPRHGRLLGPEDDRQGAPRVAVLGHSLWRRRFGGDADVLGRRIDLGHGEYTIVGVAPPGFTGAGLRRVDVWMPMATMPESVMGDGWRDSRGWYWLHALVRLRAGVEAEAAAHEVTAMHLAGRQESIEEGRYSDDAEVMLEPLIAARGSKVPKEASIALWLAGVSAVVLVIACGNVANLLLARGSRRGAEIGLRLALGAPRRRVVGQQVLDSVLLALLGGASAWLASRWVGDAIRGFLMPDVAWTDPHLAWRVLAFTAGAALVAGVAAGLLPGLRAARRDLVEVLQGGTRSVTGGRTRAQSLLTVGQIALSAMLLVGAGLFVRSLDRVQELDLGLETESLLVAVPDVDEARLTGDDLDTLFADAADRAETLGGVADVAVATATPFRTSFSTVLSVPERDELPEISTGGPYFHGVTPGYFSVLGMRLLEGRGFTEADREGSPRVVVVNRTMARLVWPGADALGRCVKIGGEEAPCSTVVGVVEDVRRHSLVEEESMQFYYPLAQKQVDWARPESLYLRLRSTASTTSAEDVAAAVSREIRGLSPELRYVRVDPLWSYVSHEVRPWRLGATLFSAFGLLALLVATTGLGGVLAFEVARRIPEIGVRAALGASRYGIIWLVVRDGLRLALAGLVLGLAAAWLLAPRIEPLLFRVSPSDPLVYGAVVAALAVVAVAASALPAWNAAGVDPVVALKTE